MAKTGILPFRYQEASMASGNKVQVVRARVTEHEREALLHVAEVEGLKLSEALRLAIREAARRREVWRGVPRP